MGSDAYQVLKWTFVELASVVLALLGGAMIGGPLARWAFGIPFGFRQDFVSAQANNQALFVQTVCVGCVLIGIGFASGRVLLLGRTRISFVLYCPLVVAIGFIVFRFVYLLIERHDLEYYNLRNGGLIVLSSPILLGASITLSRRLFRNNS